MSNFERVIPVLSYVGLMLVVPIHCAAQGRLPLLDGALPKAATAPMSSSSLATQASGSRSGGRDSLLNGTLIGFAVGAALGIAVVHAVRDSELDAGQYTYGALIFGGMGAGVGLGVDALLNHTSGVVVRSPRRVALTTRVSRKAAGIRVAMRW
jgi:hypothetical protein